MLHIHNGDSTANTLREFEFPGEHFAFQEVLMGGPAPSGLSQEDWRQTRARYLAEAYDLDVEECLKNLIKQEAALEKFVDHDKTILWFEHDLFCQINLIYLLDWFTRQEKSNAKLSLICISEFPGVENFRGLGQLTGEQMASLFLDRRAIGDEQFDTAAKAWAAYCAPDPRRLVDLMGQDTSSLPFLREALHIHLERFPSVANGLGRIENKTLELISSGATTFKSLFPRFGRSESAYGLGDSQLCNELRRLARVTNPLIKIGAVSAHEVASSPDLEATLELTEIGRAVLAGDSDFVGLNGIDQWLGGVHLDDCATNWRWDAQREMLIEGSR